METAERKRRAKAKSLFDRLTAGVKVREAEYPAWQRVPKPAAQWKADPYSGGCLADYLENKGINEDKANPAAIYWEAYDALERGEHCESCGRGGPKVCRDCAAMLDGLKRRLPKGNGVRVERVA